MIPMPNRDNTSKLIKRYLECQENLDRIEMMQKPFGYEDWELVPIPEGKKVE